MGVNWKDEWQDMPEFEMEDLSSFRKIVVHFRNQEDIDKFAELIGHARVINEDKILIIPKKYIEDYDSCTTDQGTGSGPARNFCWEHALENGATSHWLLDDNIKAFGRINRNLYIHVTSGTIFKAAEDFIERYENVALAGFNYDFLAKAKTKLPAFQNYQHLL